MEFFEEPVEKSTVFQGMIINVRADTARLHTGKLVGREVVEHSGGVVIAAVTDSGSLLTVTQYRYAIGDQLLELPAGKLEPGEDPLLCAKRELSEETGCTAKNWVSLGLIYPSPGYCSEILHVFLATDLQRGMQHPDEDEFLTISEVTFDQFWEMIKESKVCDGKTIATIAKAEQYLNRR